MCVKGIRLYVKETANMVYISLQSLNSTSKYSIEIEILICMSFVIPEQSFSPDHVTYTASLRMIPQTLT